MFNSKKTERDTSTVQTQLVTKTRSASTSNGHLTHVTTEMSPRDRTRSSTDTCVAHHDDVTEDRTLSGMFNHPSLRPPYTAVFSLLLVVVWFSRNIVGNGISARLFYTVPVP